jgi:hypothetical protein
MHLARELSIAAQGGEFLYLEIDGKTQALWLVPAVVEQIASLQWDEVVELRWDGGRSLKLKMSYTGTGGSRFGLRLAPASATPRFAVAIANLGTADTGATQALARKLRAAASDVYATLIKEESRFGEFEPQKRLFREDSMGRAEATAFYYDARLCLSFGIANREVKDELKHALEDVERRYGWMREAQASID